MRVQESMLEGGNARLSREERIKRLQALAGQYIALAHAMQPAKEVYLASLRRSEVCGCTTGTCVHSSYRRPRACRPVRCVPAT